MTVKGPDRGYSWVILLCCTYIQFALFGLFRSWGVIYVAVIAEYHVNREEASWPFSLCSSVFQLTGPAVSILTYFISKRATALLGSTIATIGVVGCYFANSVLWITVFYGVIHGLGFGIVVTLIPVLLNQYFVKHRASALGIAFSGGSVSSFVVPIAMKWLLDNYGLRGSFLLLGGLVMNTLVASALLKSAPWLTKEKTVSVSLLENSEAKDSGVSIGDTALEMKDTADFDYQVLDDLQDTVCKTTSDSQRNGDNSNSRFVDGSHLEHSNLEDDAVDKRNSIVSKNDSIFFDGSVVKIKESCNSDKRKKDEAVTNDCKVVEPLMTGEEEHIKPKDWELGTKKSKFKCSAPYSITEILTSYYFYLIAFSVLVFYVSLQSFFVVIVDYAKDKGVERNEGAYLMSVFSLTDILGRSLLGWITDRKYVKRQNMVIFNFIASSIVMQLYPLFNNFIGLLVVAAFHGIAAGSCITLFFVLQAEYFGVEKLTLVVGLSNFINGALTLIGPVIIGIFRDTIGSYDWMFRSFGLVSLLFSFMWMAESWLTRHKIRVNNAVQRNPDV